MIVELILDYLKYQDSNIISKNTIIESTNTLNSACFEVLAWLKLECKREKWIEEGKKAKMRAMKLNADYPWCELLRVLVENEQDWKITFCISENQFDFAKTVSEEEKTSIRKKAYELYNPEKLN